MSVILGASDLSDDGGVVSSAIQGNPDGLSGTHSTTDMPQRRCIVISLIRHAECEGNVNLSAMEDDHPDPLTEHGWLQAEALGQAWKDTRIDHLVSSPYQRAHDTAKTLSNHNKDHPEVHINPLLIERKRGGKVTRLLQQSKVEEAIEELTGDPWHYFGPPCPLHCPAEGGESLLDISDRAATILTTILQCFGVKLSEPPAFFIDEETTAEPTFLPDGIPHIVVVSHGFFLVELYKKLHSQMKGYRVPTSFYENADWSRHILWYDEDSKELAVSDMKICT